MNLAPPEPDSDPYLHPVIQPFSSIPHLEHAMVIGGLWAKANLLDLNLLLLLARFAFLLGLLVLELTEVHNPADGWVCVRRNLNQIQVGLTRSIEGFPDADYTHIVAARIDQANLRCPDGLIDSIT